MNILVDGFCNHIKTLGCELDIVNAARVSFKKEKIILDEDDIKLIKYLAKNQHCSPFRCCHISFHMKMPIFTMRQFVRHRFGVEINEMSGRYVEFEDNSFYIPKNFRFQSTNNKQGSSGNLPDQENNDALYLYEKACEAAFNTYKILLNMGIAKELARMVLPLSLFTEIRVTMSLEAIVHFIKLREDGHAQFEIRELSDAIKTIAIQEFPNAIPALLGI
jgi:thymidylate synthase (FAD)